MIIRICSDKSMQFRFMSYFLSQVKWLLGKENDAFKDIFNHANYTQRDAFSIWMRVAEIAKQDDDNLLPGNH